MAERRYEGLLVDFGGVLTTNIWKSFDLFCENEGLERGTVLELFRGDGEALALLRSLERGAVTDEEFERDFGELLGVDPPGLVDRLGRKRQRQAKTRRIQPAIRPQNRLAPLAAARLRTRFAARKSR